MWLEYGADGTEEENKELFGIFHDPTMPEKEREGLMYHQHNILARTDI